VSVEINFAQLEDTARRLERAARTLDEAGQRAPAGVDAGEATPLVSAMVDLVVESTCGLSEGLAAASGGVRDSLAEYSRRDDRSRQLLDELNP
jgi:hypothetical protein